MREVQELEKSKNERGVRKCQEHHGIERPNRTFREVALDSLVILTMPPRSKVFLDLQCGQDSLGRISLELFDDRAPRTSQK